MEAKDVIELLNLLEQEGIGVVVDGGWGVDSRLSRRTRPHNDLDIAIEHKHLVKFAETTGAERLQRDTPTE
jgi:lincosamide nucleotidyltransferase A/C/D/E